MSLVLMRYQGRDWHGHVRIEQEMPEFFAVCLTCDSDTNMTADVSIHVTRTTSRLLLSLFSPYWIINKTSRVLQYRAEDVSVKHPADYRDIILFSFRKKNLFSKSKVRKILGQGQTVARVPTLSLRRQISVSEDGGVRLFNTHLNNHQPFSAFVFSLTELLEFVSEVFCV